MSGPIWQRSKRDACEAEVVRVLQEAGFSVQPLSGADIPDLLVGKDDRDALIECKSGNKQLRPGQAKWHARWRGSRPVVIRNAAQARKFVRMWDLGPHVGGGAEQALEDSETKTPEHAGKDLDAGPA